MTQLIILANVIHLLIRAISAVSFWRSCSPKAKVWARAGLCADLDLVLAFLEYFVYCKQTRRPVATIALVNTRHGMETEMTDQDDPLLETKALPQPNDQSSHPAYTYGELFDCYQKFAEAVNAPATFNGLTLLSARERIKLKSFDEFVVHVQYYPLGEVARNVELWERAINRERYLASKSNRER